MGKKGVGIYIKKNAEGPMKFNRTEIIYCLASVKQIVNVGKKGNEIKNPNKSFSIIEPEI